MTAVLEIRLFGGLQIGLEYMLQSPGLSRTRCLPCWRIWPLRVGHTSGMRWPLLLWGEMPDADAKNNLRQALANLRKLLDPHLIITRDSRDL